ncbi:MAG: hypothetical protein ACHQ1H_10300, partial [Nitrososphaerales archaeon]
KIVALMALPISYLSQAAVQAGVTHFETRNTWFFEQVNKIQEVVYAVNLGAIFIGMIELGTVLSPWASLERWGEGYIWAWCGATIGWALLASKIVSLINQHLRPREDLAQALQNFCGEERARITVAWDNSTFQVWMQGLHVTQIVMSVALAFFSMNPYFYGVSAVLQLYSLLKTCEWKWLRVDRTFNVNNNGRDDGPIAYTFSYYCSARVAPERARVPAPLSTAIQAEPLLNCPICLEAEPPPNTLFCATHAFHHHCIAGAVAASSANMRGHIGNEYTTRTHMTERNQYGAVTREYITYAITVPQEALPNCPLCRGQPAQNEVGITVRDRCRFVESNISATVTIRPPQQAAQPVPGAEVNEADEVDEGDASGEVSEGDAVSDEVESGEVSEADDVDEESVVNDA